MDAAVHLAPQNYQLMSKRCIVSVKSPLRLEWRRQNNQAEIAKPKHISAIMMRRR
jgi:hypothetical protein